MDRLMRAEPERTAPPSDDVEPSASTSTMSFDALDLPERAKPDESLMDALMGSDASGSRGETPTPESESESESESECESESESDAAPEDESESEALEEQAASRGDDAGGGSDEADEADDSEPEDELPPPIVLHPDRGSSEPEVLPTAPRKKKKHAKKKGKKLFPLLVGGTVAAGLALWLGREPDPKPGSGGDNTTTDLDAKSLGPPTPDLPSAPPETTPDVGVPEAVLAPERKPPPAPDPNRDPREPPEGASAEAAAAFKRLPVSPADRAPVGGVGKTGIHVDDVSMGSVYERSRCSGGDGSFSVAQGDLVNVCLRVVHQRQKEELSVVWQKIGGNARRGKIVVKPMHAYRTRAYLKLRSEYVGDWEVKVFSQDGAQLARYPFSIVP